MKVIRFPFFGTLFHLLSLGVIFHVNLISLEGLPSKTSIETPVFLEAPHNYFKDLEHPRPIQINHDNQKLFDQGEEYYLACLYEKSIECYQLLLIDLEKPNDNSSNHELKKTIISRLGQAHYHLERFFEAFGYFKQVINPLDPLQATEIELFSNFVKSCRYLKNYHHAVELLEKRKSVLQHPLNDELQFELALNYFLLENLSQAKTQFTSLEKKTLYAPLSTLTQLYLSRILLAERSFSEAATKLAIIVKELPKEHLLHFEVSYLQGEAAFNLQDYNQATLFFEKALPQRHHENAEWYSETLYHLGWSHLKLADNPSLSVELQCEHFSKAETAFEKLLQIQPDEHVSLALAQSYLTQGSRFKDASAYLHAEEILSRPQSFKTLEAKTHALLLRAEAATTYEERRKFYQELIEESNLQSSFYGKGWYLKGLNDYDYGLSENSEVSKSAFLLAADALAKASELLESTDPSRAALAFKYQIQAYHHHHSSESLTKALFLIQKQLEHPEILLQHLEEPQEIAYLYGLIALSILKENDPLKNSTIDLFRESLAFSNEATIENTLINPQFILKNTIQENPEGTFSDACMNLLAAYYFEQENFIEAETTFAQLAKKYPNSSYAGEALYWSACCAEKLKKDPALIQNYRKQLFENHPLSSFAPAAYFTYYSYRDYLQGDRAALKHLQAFHHLFPNSPLQINSYFLLGLDYKRERKSSTGRAIRKKNLIHAINAFSKAELIFDTLYQQQKIPHDELDYYLTIRYRALLERALANQAVALESLSTKRTIYSQYAQDLFIQINQELTNTEHPFASHLTQEQPFPKLQEESLYLLTKSYIKFENDEAAKQVIQTLLEKYKALHITKSYYLSRVYYEQGLLAMRQKDYHLAGEAFKHAEESNEKVLSVDQKLDLWIQQSECYKALQQMDMAMLILSKVINDNTISSLRVKAMYLRAEIYALQGRHELARKQLTATANKGGDWAIKAKIKLDEEYGYR